MSLKAPTPSTGLAHVLKANPYHDAAGRFSTRDGAKFVSIGGIFSKTNAKDRGAPLKAKESAKDYEGRVTSELLSLKEAGVNTLSCDPASWVKLSPNVSPKELVSAVVGAKSLADGTMGMPVLMTDELRQRIHIVSRNYGKPLLVHGAEASVVERTFNFKTKDVHHDLLKLLPSAQGGGAVKKMFAASIPLYKKMGMDSVSVQANLDGGGYAWGRYGFKADSATSYHREVSMYVEQFSRTLKSRTPMPAAANNELKELKTQIDNLSKDDDAPQLITSIKTPNLTKHYQDTMAPDRKTETFIQRAMKDTNWHGHMNFSDKAQMKTLSTYVGKAL